MNKPLSFVSFLPAIGWFILSLVLLCLPGSRVPKYPFLALIHADKWIHIGLLGMLCFLFNLPLGKAEWSLNSKKRGFLLISLGGIFYGTVMEFVQKYWIAGRSFEILDILADSIGCIIAYSVSKHLLLKKE